MHDFKAVHAVVLFLIKANQTQSTSFGIDSFPTEMVHYNKIIVVPTTIHMLKPFLFCHTLPFVNCQSMQKGFGKVMVR